MRQSVGLAYQTTYTILVDVILGTKDIETRDHTWRATFMPIFHAYLVPADPNPKLEPYLEQIFTEVLTHLWRRRSAEFKFVWDMATVMCMKYLVMHFPQGDGTEYGFQPWAHLALSLLPRVLEGNLKEDNTVDTDNLDEKVKSFLEISGFLVAKVWQHMTQGHPGGYWDEGMEFLATMFEDPLFCECLVKVDSMAKALDIFKSSVPDQRIRPYLRLRAFLRVVVVFCRLFQEEGAEVWEIALDNAIPKDCSDDIQKSISRVYKLVSVLKPSYTYLKAPPGVNESFAQGIANVLNLIEDPESDEAKKLTDLLVSIVSLRGNLLGPGFVHQ